ncbi:MAG: Crp/Fnr family transcriptional regulator [Rhodobacterales bacterium]|nr:Crp/Fnr family transcriptional regulator [Rhodobacterales bacterium]
MSASDIRAVTLSAQQTLFHQEATPHALYYVASGAVTLQRHTEAGQLVTLHRASAGDLIAEASLFSPHYHCDCIAETPSTCIALDITAVRNRMADNPDFAAALVQRFARQVQGYRRQLELRSIKSAKQRVLAGLSDGWLQGNVLHFAADMGLTHEATYRALAELVSDGAAIKTGRGKYRAATP